MRTVGRIAVAVALAGLLLVFAKDMVAIDYPNAEAEYEQLQCVRQLILDEIPEVGSFRVIETDLYWQQRLKELAFPERQVSNDGTPIRITGGPCDGVGVAFG